MAENSIPKPHHSVFPRVFSRVVYWELREVWPLFIRMMLMGKLGNGPALVALSEYMHTQFPDAAEVCFLDSGSSCIAFALQLFLRQQLERRKVLVPIYICHSVIQAIKAVGLEPCFIEVTPQLTLDPKDLQCKLQTDTLAVLVPHIYGYPAPIAECVRLIKQLAPTTFIIDDAAPGFLTMVENRKLGTWGDVGVFSFGPSKKFPASGGGALLISNQALVESARDQMSRLPAPSNQEAWRSFFNFWWNLVGIRYSLIINYWIQKIVKRTPRPNAPAGLQHMSNLNAALILWFRERAGHIHRKRAEIMAYYVEALQNLPQVAFPQPDASEYSVARFYLRTPGIRAVRNAQGRVIQPNPLVTYLETCGIRTGYGYTLSEDLIGHTGYQMLTERYDWLNELVWLPIDHKREIAHYAVVTDAIRAFFAASHPHPAQ